MRVSMSAMGSEIFMGLPARLGHTRQLAQQGALPEADAAQGEATHVAARSSADGATVVAPDVVPLLALRLGDEGLLGHRSAPRSVRERHAEECQQALGLLVVGRRRDDAHLEPTQAVDLVVVDLRERELLAQAQGVVATPVERLAGHTPEVTDARQCDTRQALQ